MQGTLRDKAVQRPLNLNGDMTEEDNTSGVGAEARTKQRDQAASELVRALLIINGGGAVALLAFLQAIWASEKALAKPTIAALVALAFGAVCAAAFHFFRHQASWYNQKTEKEKWAKFRRFYLVSAALSLIAFVVGTAIVALGAWTLLPHGT